MPIATFRGERSVNEVTDKLFSNLTDRQREIASTAILKANPQLADIKNVRDGTVLRVPKIPELRPKTNRSLENPDAQIANDINDALSHYRKTIGERVAQSQESTKQQMKLAGNTSLKRLLAQHDGASKLADELKGSLKQRATALTERSEKFERAVRQISKDLNKGPV